MAYANKYKITFEDNLLRPCEIYILQDNYVGSVIELQPSFNPCVITYNGNVSNKIDNIITSEISIGIIKQVGDNFSEFYTTNEDLRIEVYKDYGSGLELDWKGFLIPDSYQEELQYPPIEVKLNGICGLSRLKFFNYQVEDFDLGTTYIAKQVGTKRITDFLAEIFTRADSGVLGMEYFYTFFDFQGYGFNPKSNYSTNSFEYRYYIDSALAYDNNGKALTYFQLLTEIAKSQLARVFQYKGEYYIISTPLYTLTSVGVENSFEDYVEFDGGSVETATCGSNFLNEFYSQNLPLNKNNISTGNYVSHTELPITKTYGSDYIYALTDQIISYQAGIRNAQVTSKIDRGAPFVNNFSFDTWLSTDPAPLAWEDLTGGLLIRQEYNNDIANTNYAEQGSLISLGLSSNNFTTTIPNPGDPYTFIKTIPSIISNNAKIKFRFYHRYTEPIDTGVTITLPFVIRAGNKYARPISGGSSWSNTPYIWTVTFDQTNVPQWDDFQAPSTTETSFFTNLILDASEYVGGLEIGFYLPYVQNGILTVPGILRIDDVQILTPESVGLYQNDRRRLDPVSEWGIFGFNNSNITGKIKYTDFDYLSSSFIDKDSNNDITLLLSSYKPTNVRRFFYVAGGGKGFIFPNDYPAGGFVVQDGSNIYNYNGNFARFCNPAEFERGEDGGQDYYYLYLMDLFRLYEKVMQVFQGTLYPNSSTKQFSIIDIFVDNINNDGVMLLPSKLEIDYKTAFTKMEAFEIQGNDKVIGTITIPVGNYVAANDPDIGEG